MSNFVIQQKRGHMFGKTLVIINPTARSGKATEVAAKASVRFTELLEQETDNPELTLYHTVAEKDATYN